MSFFLFFIYFFPFVETFLRLTAASSSPHLILNQLCWLVLTLYFSYFTGSCRSRSPGGLENPDERGRAATRRGKDLQNENVKRSYGKRVRVCKCPCSKRRKGKKMSKWVWYRVIIMAAMLEWKKRRVQKIARVVRFFPLGVNDGNISQALWHFHFHNCVISRNFSHLRKLSWKHERLRGRNGERGQPLALLHPPPHPCCLCFTFPSYLLSFCSGYLHFSLSPPSSASVFKQHWTEAMMWFVSLPQFHFHRIFFPFFVFFFFFNSKQRGVWHIVDRAPQSERQ